MALAASLWRRHWEYAPFLVLALAESHAQLRYPFHAWVRDQLLGFQPDHTEKTDFQSALLNVVATLAILALLVLVPKLRRASHGSLLMISGSAIVIALLAIELISLHGIDAVIYQSAGPFTRAAVVYFVGAAAIAGGALMRSRPSSQNIVTNAPLSADPDA